MRVIHIISIGLVFVSGLLATRLADGNIYHQVVTEAVAQEPLTLEAVVEVEDAAVVGSSIYYRVKGQTTYLEASMSSAGGNLYFGTIPAGDITTDGLEYYLVAMLEDESILAFPVDNPEVNPISVVVRPPIAEAEAATEADIFEEALAQVDEASADVLILSPEPMQFYLPEDVVVGVSFFNIEDLDDSSIRLLIDGQDVTSQAAVSADLVTYSPSALESGAHQVEVHMNRTSGAAYPPVAWRFLVTEKASFTTERAYRQSGTITPAYQRDMVDEQVLEVMSVRMSYRGGWDWMKFRTSAKFTSQEDQYKPPRNRYSAAFQTPLLKVGVGDVTPRFNRFAMDGKRLRGYDANLTLKLFNLRVAQGELERVIQGRPSEAYDTPDYSFNESLGAHEISLPRSSYTFKRDILAIRPSFGGGQNFELVPLFVVKAKDDVVSVDSLVQAGEVNIPAELGAHPAFLGEDWYGSTATHDTVEVDTGKVVTSIARPLDMSRLMELAEQYPDLMVNLDEGLWTGKTPEDNLVIGSSLMLATKKRRFSIQSGFAFSMLNKNIWDPVFSKDNLDTLSILEDTTLDGNLAGAVAIPFDPAAFEDQFHMNLNQIPLVPIDVLGITENPLRAIAKMPSLAYHATAKFNYLRNYITLEYQQVGPQFNSLANPNLQKNVRVRSFSDRIRLFKNKLFLTAVFRSTDDDIVKVRVEDDPKTAKDESLDSEPITRTRTVNLSANLNLGFGLPSFTVSQRTYERNNGVEDTVQSIIDEDLVIRDDRENTLTTSRTIGMTYRLMLLESSHDLNLNIATTTVEDLIAERYGDASLTSPNASSSVFSLSANSRISRRLETNVVLSTNSSEIGESGTETYVTQDIFQLDASARMLLLDDRLGLRGGIRFTSNTTNEDENPVAPPSFTQMGIRAGTSYRLVENLQFVTDFRFRSKSLEIDGEPTTLPSSLISARLEYVF